MTIRAWMIVVAMLLSTAVSHAGPRTLLVLPLDGSADPAVRAKLNLSLQKAASKRGKVTVGDTTFAETAAAVGCVATAPTCAETVRSTLGVDELVYGTATWRDGQTVLVVNRTVAKEPSSSGSVVLAAGDPPERAEAMIGPLLDGRTGSSDPVPEPPAAVEPPPTPVPGAAPPVSPVTPGYDNHERNKGIVLASAGGVTFAIGLVLWSSKASVQKDIDDAPTRTPADFTRLEALESRAFKYAMIGNVLVIGGLALGGYGGWILYQDRNERRLVATPQLTPTTAGATVEGRW